MSERKYRGKRVDNGEWVYGAYFCLHHNDGRQHIHHFIIPDNTQIPKEKPIGEIQVEVDPATVGQYTGLKDKNGVEICEGDIVTFNNNNFKVVYKQDRYYIGWVATDEGENCYIHIWYDDIEVLGNIYDNPEMLRQWKGH